MANKISQKSQDILQAALAAIEAEEKSPLFTVTLHKIGEPSNDDLTLGKNRRGRYRVELLKRRDLLMHEEPNLDEVSEEVSAIWKAGKPVEDKYKALEGTYDSEEVLTEAVKKFPEVTYNDGKMYLGGGGRMSVISYIAMVHFIGV